MSELSQFLVNLAKECNIQIDSHKAEVVINNRIGIITEQEVLKRAPELIAAASQPILNVPYFTIQTPEMLDILLSGSEWFADPERARESGTIWERKSDCEAVGGAEPIYVFMPHNWNTEKDYDQSVHADLNELRSEMSTSWKNLYGKYLYVLSLPEDLPVATGHNGCCWVRIIPKITKDMLLAAYEIQPFFSWWLQSYCTQFVADQFREHELHRLIQCPSCELVCDLIRAKGGLK